MDGELKANQINDLSKIVNYTYDYDGRIIPVKQVHPNKLLPSRRDMN